MRSEYLMLIAIVLAALTVPGCSENGSKVVLDSEHRPIFKNYEELRNILADSGLEVVNGGVGDLGGASAYILLGPAHRVYEKEIVEFVENGGVLIAMIHIPPSNLMPILKEFGMRAEMTPVERDIVRAVPSVRTDLSEGVKSIVLYGAFRVSNPVFVESRDVVSLAVDEMGLVGMVKYGKGYVIVVGDDAAFTDAYIDSADNRKFIENLARFIAINGKG